MLAEVVQHVDQRIPHLSWRGEGTRVIAVAKDATLSPEDAIGGLGDADGEPLDAAGEGSGAVGFDQQVHVIGLHAELRQRKCSCEAAASAVRISSGATS